MDEFSGVGDNGYIVITRRSVRIETDKVFRNLPAVEALFEPNGQLIIARQNKRMNPGR